MWQKCQYSSKEYFFGLNHARCSIHNTLAESTLFWDAYLNTKFDLIKALCKANQQAHENAKKIYERPIQVKLKEKTSAVSKSIITWL